MKKILSILSISFIIIGCGGSTNNSEPTIYSSKNVNITFNNNKEQDVKLVKKASSANINLHIDGTKDIYLVVSSHFNDQRVTITDDASSGFGMSQNRINSNEYNSSKDNLTPKKVLDFRTKGFRDILNKKSTNRYKITPLKRSISSVDEGDSSSFCIDMDSDYNCTNKLVATAKKVIKNINTTQGTKSLVIWLEDGNNISQNKIDSLANMFLRSGDDNDIYDWDTNLFGQEWGSCSDDELIEESDVIDILIYNMQNSNLAGYFWAKDNYKKSALDASNEKIMFYINSQMVDSNLDETYTTLAHEFQHMINFYQRAIKKGIDDPVWFNEMLSETTEDIVATKIGIKGPRNVDSDDGSAGNSRNRGGRYPDFNRNNTTSLTNWHRSRANYSTVSSFGAFLTRNYGGAKVLHDMFYSNKEGEDAVIDATKESDFHTILNKWGVAVMLSDIENPQNMPTYNFGDFKITTRNSITYKLGSINFFNYSPEPSFYDDKTLNINANMYYRVGYNLSGDINIKVNAQKGVDIAIVAK